MQKSDMWNAAQIVTMVTIMLISPRWNSWASQPKANPETENPKNLTRRIKALFRWLVGSTWFTPLLSIFLGITGLIRHLRVFPSVTKAFVVWVAVDCCQILWGMFASVILSVLSLFRNPTGKDSRDTLLGILERFCDIQDEHLARIKALEAAMPKPRKRREKTLG